MLHSHNAAAGIYTAVQPRTHERPRDWQTIPPRGFLAAELVAAHAAYMAAVQHQSRLDHERAALFADDADTRALQADTQAAALVAPGEEVTTAALDKLAADRRRVLVAQGGAALACDNALRYANEIRHGGHALDPAATAAADKARAAAVALLDKLAPLLDTLADHAAAVRWTHGERYSPSRDLHQLAAAIREELTA